MIPVYKPYISKYKESAINAINSEWISNHGIYIKLAIEKLKSIYGIKHCILMNNGTSATHCLFKALKYKYPNIKKIYLPNNVFIAPWNCSLMEYNKDYIEIMKIDNNTLNIDTSEEYIKTLEYNSAICIVHNLGNIINVPRLKRLRPDIIYIEDNCEGFLGKYEGKYTGTECLCSSVSFYGNKIITTGEGGAFFTNDDSIYEYINNIYSHGMTSKKFIHCNIATNFRMTNIQAAFLYDQLNDINHIIDLKKNVYYNYINLLKPLLDTNKIKLYINENDTEHSKWMFTIIIPNKSYEFIENYMFNNNIEIRPVFYDIHNHIHLKHIKNNFDTLSTKLITNSSIILPSFPELKLTDQMYIVNIINNIINNNI